MLTATPVADGDDDDVFLPSRQVQRRYSVSEMTLGRWRADPRLGFPKPLVVLNRHYWKLLDLRAWEKARTATDEGAPPREIVR